MFIPKKIKVGYQDRKGTYTGKLAYVIYYDEKDKLRKENSWESWRDTRIEPDDFENVPTEGFVLNKHVGGYSSGWNHRNSYIRVYDPRGFEFEISVENLLFILEHCSAIKGKGIEGEFVYAWDGKDLVLLPVDSAEYKEIKEKTEIRYNATYFKGKELKPGLTYETLSGKQYLYLGKFDYYKREINRRHKSWWRSSDYQWDYPLDETWLDDPLCKDNSSFKVRYIKKKGKQFYFARIYNDKIIINPEYPEMFSSVTNKFCRIVNENIHPKFSEIIEYLEHLSCVSPVNFDTTQIHKLSYDEFVNMINKLEIGQRCKLQVRNYYNCWRNVYFERTEEGYRKIGIYGYTDIPYLMELNELGKIYGGDDYIIIEARYLENGKEEFIEKKEWDYYE